MKKIIIIIIVILIIILFFLNFNKDKKSKEIKSKIDQTEEDINYNSNIIKDVSYSSKDNDGNEYIINASEGEIDYSDTSIIYLTNVNGPMLK